MNRYLSLAMGIALGVGLTLGGMYAFDQRPTYEISYVETQWAYDISDPRWVDAIAQ